MRFSTPQGPMKNKFINCVFELIIAVMVLIIIQGIFTYCGGAGVRPTLTVTHYELKEDAVAAAQAVTRPSPRHALGFVLNTGSMRPLLDSNSVLVIDRQFPFEDVMPGDVVVVQAVPSVRPVVHMVVDIRDGMLITHGINNDRPDPCPCPHRGFIGKVVQAWDWSQ